MIYMLDPDTDPSLADFLTTFGVKADNDVVIDPLAQVALKSASAPIGVPVGSHKITEQLTRSPVPSFFPLARSLQRAEPAPAGTTVDFLLQTAEAEQLEPAWGETDLSILHPAATQEALPQPSFDDKDVKGPLELAALATIQVATPADQAKPEEKPDEAKKEEDKADEKKKQAMVAVFGDSDFASNTNFNLGANGDLFLNTVSYLAEEEDLLSIRPKEAGKQTLTMTTAQSGFVMYMSLLIMPSIPLLLGIYTFVRKRNL
jgi:ABC-type uncharacterized transport system involved in gliding motility auxiliary subunit